MHAADKSSRIAQQLPDLDTLDVQSLKALIVTQQAELDSRTTEIENLKLLIFKLKRMHFGPRSEKFNQDIQQLELRLEDLEASQAACGTTARRTGDGRAEAISPAQARAASVAGCSASGDRDDCAWARSVSRLRRQTCATSARMFRKCLSMCRRTSR